MVWSRKSLALEISLGMVHDVVYNVSLSRAYVPWYFANSFNACSYLA